MRASLSISTPIKSARQSPRSMNNSLQKTQLSDGHIYRPSKENFALLKEIFSSDFASLCYIDFIYPQLIFQFHNVENTFHLFMQYALGESNWTFAKIKTNSPDVKPNSTLRKKADEFLIQWVEFMNLMPEVLSNGIAPHLECLNGKVTKFDETLTNFSSIFKPGDYKSDVCLSSIKKIKREAHLINKKAAKLFRGEDQNAETESKPMKSEKKTKRASPKPKKSIVEPEQLIEKAKSLNDEISNLFSKTMSKSTLTTGELYRIKTVLNQTCGDMIQIITGAINFPQISDDVRNQIYQVNSALGKLFNTINIPFSVTTENEEEEHPNTEVAEVEVDNDSQDANE